MTAAGPVGPPPADPRRVGQHRGVRQITQAVLDQRLGPGRDCCGDDHDEDRHEDQRQIGDDGVQVVADRVAAEHPETGGQDEQHDGVEDQPGEDLGGVVLGRGERSPHATAFHEPVEADPLQDLGQDLRNDLGYQIADDDDDQERDELGNKGRDVRPGAGEPLTVTDAEWPQVFLWQTLRSGRACGGTSQPEQSAGPAKCFGCRYRNVCVRPVLRTGRSPGPSAFEPIETTMPARFASQCWTVGRRHRGRIRARVLGRGCAGDRAGHPPGGGRAGGEPVRRRRPGAGQPGTPARRAPPSGPGNRPAVRYRHRAQRRHLPHADGDPPGHDDPAGPRPAGAGPAGRDGAGQRDTHGDGNGAQPAVR